MRKAIGCVGICLLMAACFWGGTVLSDRQRLHENLIRLHVVANSNTQEDQIRKLQVRDTITRSLEADLGNIVDVQQAEEYLQSKLPYIQSLAEGTLKALGCDDSVSVSLCREKFGKRIYDTFTLPAGVYNALRIVIGEGQGQNWWCVVFPGLCIPAASDGFENVAAGAGFPQSLQNSLTGEEGYELRFVVLDALGRLENILYAG